MRWKVTVRNDPKGVTGYWIFGDGTQHRMGDYIRATGRVAESCYSFQQMQSLQHQGTGLLITLDDPDILLPDGI